jgi:ATP-dependent Clp protease ATP-binding subunit ClpA
MITMSPTHEALGFVWHIAQMEAVRLSHEYIDTEHILLALVQTRRCAAYSLLSEMKAFPSHIFLEIERRLTQGTPFQPSAAPPISRKVQELWNKIPEMMEHEYREYPVTIALLLALLQQEGTLCHAVLSSFGVTEAKIRELQWQPQMV